MVDKLQVLREIDKLDRIGPDGVRKMLTTGMKDASGTFNKGVGLDDFTAEYFVTICTQKGEGNVILANLQRLHSRLNLMIKLEETVIDGDTTAWDQLINMTPNADETWANGGRPANIGWALDDIINQLNKEFKKDTA